MAEERKIKLGLTEYPNTDKVYIIRILERDDGWIVLAKYGKRGRAHNTSIKPTTGSTTFIEANHIFDRLLEQKLKKGYTEESW